MNSAFSMSGVRYFKLSVVISLVLSMLIVLSPLGAPQAIANIGPISITSFTIENPVFKTNEKFTLKAELNRKPGPSESLRTFFIEEETGEVVRQCRNSETSHQQEGETFKATVSAVGAIPGITGFGLRGASVMAKSDPGSIIGYLGNPNSRNFAQFRTPVREIATVRNPARNFTRIHKNLYFAENYTVNSIGPAVTIICVAS